MKRKSFLAYDREAITRPVATSLLLALTCLLTACSYSVDFAVVNRSGQPVEVWYRYKASTGDARYWVEKPAKKPASQLHDGEPWQAMGEGQYHLDGGTLIVRARIMPGEALLVDQATNYGAIGEANDAKIFPIEELTLAGASGELKMTGDMVRKAFEQEDDQLYILTYR